MSDGELNFMKGAFYLALTICIVFVAQRFGRFETKAEGTLNSIAALQTDATRTMAELSGVLNTTRQVLVDERSAANKQLAEVDGLNTRASKLLDVSVETMQHLDASAVQLGAIGASADSAITSMSADAHATLVASKNTLDAATADLNDPAIKNTLTKVSDSSDNVASATKDAAGAMADLHKGTTYEVAQLMRPVKKIETVGLVVTRFVGKFFGF